MWNLRLSPPLRVNRTARLVWGVAILGAATLLTAQAEATAADILVRVQGVQPGPGRVFVSLCVAGLLPENCGQSQVVAADGPSVTVRFADLSPGIYAVAAFQDLNGNGTLDRSPRGLPREPYGFSREAGRAAAPRFDRAAFAVDDAASVVVRLAGPGRP